MKIITDWGRKINEPLQALNLSKVDSIALHHMAHPTADILEVQRWHLNQGWRAIGYNYWIGFDGAVYEGRGLNLGAGVANQNGHIISIGFQGDYDKPQSMPDAQFNAGIDLIAYLKGKIPTIKKLGGHRDFMATDCPGKYFPLDEFQSGKKRGDSEAVSDKPLTVQYLRDIVIQEIYPPNFGIYVCDCPKNSVGVDNYFNAGFFAQTKDGTIPIGNLADSGIIYAQSKDNPNWINVAGKPLTTLYVKNGGSFGIAKMDSLEGKDIKTAISGIPIVINGRQIPMEEIKAEGVEIAHVTLHVGLGTFRPVKADDILDHHMHSEFYRIEASEAEKINRAKESGHRVICVGTTSCRTVESAADENGKLKECSGWTEIFIYPGYKFKVLDCLITNFHLPESTLIMLVSALAGREHVLAAYEEAVKERYRFFSFGDAMFIE